MEKGIKMRILKQCWALGAGVTDAIQKGYLSRLYFGLSADAEGKLLLEVELFTLNFSLERSP
jgi:hypothetical protein